MRLRLDKWRRMLGGVLLIVGMALLLFAVANLAYDQWQAWQYARVVALAPTRIVVTARPLPPMVASAAISPTATVDLVAGPTQQPPVVLPGSIDEDETPTPPPAKSAPAALTLTPRTTPTAPRPTAIPSPSPTVIPSSLPVRLIMPWLHLDVPVVEMTWQVKDTPNGPLSEWLVPDNAAGHHSNSASLGENGNLVISGHNNIKGKVFKPISVSFDPKQPDKFLNEPIRVVAADGRSFNYTVKIVHFFLEKGAPLAERQENGRVMDDTPAPMLTIITCWPPTSNTHRIVIQAELDTRDALDGGLKP